MNIYGTFINLLNSKERCSWMYEQISVHAENINFTRFNAVSSNEEIRAKITPREVACFRSHTELISSHRRSEGVLIVLEDDVRLCKNFGSLASSLVLRLGTLPWDIIFLGHTITHLDLNNFYRHLNLCSHVGDIANERFSNFQILSANEWYRYGTFAYALSESGKERLANLLSLAASNGFDAPIDHTIRSFLVSGQLRGFTFFPFLVGLNSDFESDVSDRRTPSIHTRHLVSTNLFVYGESTDRQLIEAYRRIGSSRNDRAFIFSSLIYESLLNE
jgi:GR25 family glycosyltransferase involved in LPS biosynthesis